MMRAEGSFDWHCRSLVDSAGFDGTRDRFVRSFGTGCEHRQHTLLSNAAALRDPAVSPLHSAAPSGADQRRSE